MRCVSLAIGHNRPVASGAEILTVGHSNHEERRFLELLGGAGVELGGRREPMAGPRNVGWEERVFRGYSDHMASGEFAAGIARLEASLGV
jgi:hypothetical protein